MIEATKRPWGYVHHKGLDKHLVGAVLENVAIVEDRHGNPKENAELIVKAVNAHDALVAACEAMRDCGMFDLRWEGAIAYEEEAALVMAALEAAK